MVRRVSFAIMLLLTYSSPVVAQLVIGVIPINGIPFAVTSTFPGINNFNRQATIPTSALPPLLRLL